MRNFWKWYYYGCYQVPSMDKTLASNLRHVRRLWGILGRDVADRDLARAALTLSMIPYTCARDWLDLCKKRPCPANRQPKS